MSDSSFHVLPKHMGGGPHGLGKYIHKNSQKLTDHLCFV